MPKQRKFGKRRYDFVSRHSKKKSAKDTQTYLKSRGWVARITQSKRRGQARQYEVWKAWKK